MEGSEAGKWGGQMVSATVELENEGAWLFSS